MRKSPGRPRIASRLSASLDQRLNFYALAASAAGVSLLASVQPSEAKIIYTKTHHVIGNDGIYPLDLNHDGTIDFLIQEGTGVVSNSLGVKPAYGNGAEGSSYLAAALKKGAPIGPQQVFLNSSGSWGLLMAGYGCSDFGCGTGGNWVNVNNRYLGLKFKINGRAHYGWARLSVQIHGPQIKATLTGYAYETTPKKEIHAGQTQGVADGCAPSPGLAAANRSSSAAASVEITARPAQPASLGRLALGATNVIPWRQP